MKKLNNKGMTLMELLVSVVLISVIMIFMYKLISDVRNEKKENDKITDNILKISEIEVDSMNHIFDKLYEKDVKKIELWNDIWYSNSGSGNYATGQFVRLDIFQDDGTKEPFSIGLVDEDTDIISYQIRYHDGTNWKTLESWRLSEEIEDANIKEECRFDSSKKSLLCSIKIELLDKNKKNIENITYPFHVKTDEFKTDDFGSSTGNLTRYCKTNGGINNCTHCVVDNGRAETTTYSYNRTYKASITDINKPISGSETNFINGTGTCSK